MRLQPLMDQAVLLSLQRVGSERLDHALDFDATASPPLVAFNYTGATRWNDRLDYVPQ